MPEDLPAAGEELERRGASATLWQGRFAEGPSDALLAFTESLSFDRRLAADDVEGSRAHVRMLGAIGLLTEEEATSVLAALDTVERGWTPTRSCCSRPTRTSTRSSSAA